jgi:hypothetical protein
MFFLYILTLAHFLQQPATSQCSPVPTCFHLCQQKLDNLRGASIHNQHRSTENKRDAEDPCRLGCCLRQQNTYEQCSTECMTYAHASISHDHKQILIAFKRCALGCDYKCRWDYLTSDQTNEDEKSENNNEDECRNAAFTNVMDYTKEITEAHARQLLTQQGLREELEHK